MENVQYETNVDIFNGMFEAIFLGSGAAKFEACCSNNSSWPLSLWQHPVAAATATLSKGGKGRKGMEWRGASV